MNNASLSKSPDALAQLHREQLHLRIWLAMLLIAATCAFALMISWLGRESPVNPLLNVKVSLLALLTVYAMGVAAAAAYARWIRVKREPLLQKLTNKN